MKYLILSACVVAIASLPVARTGNSRLKITESITPPGSQGACMTDRDVAESLATLSSPLSKPEVQRERLLSYARRSPKCRARIVAALLQAMNKPDLNLERDQASFFLWHYGGEVLRALRASEALDLLIANLGVTDGASASMTHFPAVETVIGIGPISIPKLSHKLKHEERPGIRRLAVFCIAKIGGTPAKQALLEALPKENDKCVSDFIKLTLKSFDNKEQPNQIAVEDTGKWFSAFYCTG